MTMSHAVISCLHANLAACEAVLADIDQQGIDTITCLGDLVGYGPQPNEVIELIRERFIPTYQGCWERTSSTDSTPANAAIPPSWPSVAVTAHTTGLLSASLKTTRLFWQACP